MEDWNEPNKDDDDNIDALQHSLDEQWDRVKIQQMLGTYLLRLDKFRNPKIMKKLLWDEVGNEVGKTGDSCDKKFRNLKQTYIRLLKRKTQCGQINVKWPYFHIFDDIFEDDPNFKQYVDPEVIIIQSMTNDPSSDERASPSLKRRPKHVPVTSWPNFPGPSRKRRFENIHKLTAELKEKQRIIEDKLDKIIVILEDSNNIQRERNFLFQQYIEKISKT